MEAVGEVARNIGAGRVGKYVADEGMSFVGDDGEVEKLDWPADELTVDAHRATA